MLSFTGEQGSLFRLRQVLPSENWHHFLAAEQTQKVVAIFIFAGLPLCRGDHRAVGCTGTIKQVAPTFRTITHIGQVEIH